MKKMLKYLTHELDKDDRDYRRFFQSRNVSLSSFSKFRNLNNDKRVSGRKNKINENSFFPMIAKKMLKIFTNAKKKLDIVKNGDHSLSSNKGLKILKKEIKLITS